MNVSCENGDKLCYYMYKGKNIDTNCGTHDVEYFLSDKVMLKAGFTYALNFKVNTTRAYEMLKDAKVTVQFNDGPNTDAKALHAQDDINPIDGEDTSKAQTQNINSTPVESYVCLKITGKLIGSSNSCTFSDFSIEESGVTPPVITMQPEASINVDTNNVHMLRVTAIGDNLTYKWYMKEPFSSWTDTGNTTPAFMPTSFCPNCLYKCIVSNAGGEVESNITMVKSVIVHGTEYPKHSGVYYAAVAMPQRYKLDKNTVAYKAVWNKEKKVFNMVPINRNDAYIPRYEISGGLILRSSNKRMVLSYPKTTGRTTSYKGNELLESSYYIKGKSYVLGFNNGTIGMYLGEENEVPTHIAIYNSDDGSISPDGIEMFFP